MKPLIPTLFFLVLFSPPLLSGQARPRPPGLQQADQAEVQSEKNLPPPSIPHSAVDAARLAQEADELASLARSIPPDIQSVAKGMLPKDVIQKLRQIEKLSKHLRAELAP